MRDRTDVDRTEGAKPLGQSGSELPPFPFFVGCSRSGTTLLRAIFTAHPQMAIPDEAHYVMQMLRSREKYERPDGFAVEVFLHDLLNHKLFPAWVLPKEVVQESFRATPPGNYPDAVRRVFSLHARQWGKPRYGDKSPRNVLNLPLLAEAFPEAVFVHIIRDGRDVALSLLELPWAGPDTIVEAATYWRRRVQRGRKGGRSIGSSRYREVRYETLLEDPESTVRSLCEFIKLPFDPIMLRYYEQEDLFGHRSKPEPERRTKAGHHHKPPTKGLRDWRTQMSKSDLALFEVAAGDLLDELAYERGMADISSSAKLKGRLLTLGNNGRLAFQRLIHRTRTSHPRRFAD